jgi:hypothetical protein
VVLHRRDLTETRMREIVQGRLSSLVAQLRFAAGRGPGIAAALETAASLGDAETITTGGSRAIFPSGWRKSSD